MNAYNKGKKCKAGNCNREAVCKELCTKHYQQQKLRGNLIEKNYIFIDGICKMIGCGKPILAKGYCQFHYKEITNG